MSTKDLVVDASVILAACFPDEKAPQALRLMEDYATGRVDLWAPRLLALEFINACLVARRRSRIGDPLLDNLVDHFLALEIRWVGVEKNARQVLALAKEYGLTSYDAAYVAAAKILGCRMVTGDRGLYNAVRNGLPFVVPLERYGEEWR
ncbi:MAG: type II toxin-antitoxin system VapC family toxin [Clostridia bacterium]|jgi:predicted nucleic acid-binding protein|nr:type II toxin-antitoxin system VapC family toxin [Clostridia bacterium]MDH7573131.1 type II toxin-antitoxin system VapC family toxin [Clostridia bacterium]